VSDWPYVLCRLNPEDTIRERSVGFLVVVNETKWT